MAAIGGLEQPQFRKSRPFFSAAAEAMRRILIDRARRKLRMRHGGCLERVDIDEHEIAAPGDDEQLVAVHEALDLLAKSHPVQAEVVKLRYFAGMTNEETAQALEVSVATVKNYWTFARIWIFNQIKNS
jgi:RNA polymerase sigma factor (TIGR02999 family)